MIGQKFTHWIVLEKRKFTNGRNMYLCKCSCGNIKEVNIADLKAGKTKRCIECLHPKVKPSDMVGKKFGSWTVLKFEDVKKNSRHYKCKCKCGKTHIIRGDILRSGKSTQCNACRYGKIKEKRTSMIGQKFGKRTVLSEARPGYLKCQCICGDISFIDASNLRRGKQRQCKKCRAFIHGMNGTPTYNTWKCMVARCTNPKQTNYKDYGGRGIKICAAWRKFENFFSDMGIRPDGTQIDRKNNNGNYEPSNCRWVTPKENSNNRRKRSIL